MSYSDTQIWLIIAALGLGTFVIRFSFLGLVGDRKLPEWLLRHLRYTPVAILPALVAPLVIWPDGAEGGLDPVRITAAILTIAAGYLTKNPLWAIVVGVVSFTGLGALLG